LLATRSKATDHTSDFAESPSAWRLVPRQADDQDV